MSTPKKSRNENEKRFQAEIAKKEKKLKKEIQAMSLDQKFWDSVYDDADE